MESPDVFAISETSSVCAVLGTHREMTSVKCTKANRTFDFICFRYYNDISCMFLAYFQAQFHPGSINFVYRKKLFPESVTRNISFQILQGLSFIHKHGRCNVFPLCHAIAKKWSNTARFIKWLNRTHSKCTVLYSKLFHNESVEILQFMNQVLRITPRMPVFNGCVDSAW